MSSSKRGKHKSTPAPPAGPKTLADLTLQSKTLRGDRQSLAGLGGSKSLAGLGGQSLAGPVADDDTPELFRGVDYQDNTEHDMKAELDTLQSAFQQRAKEEAERFLTTTDSAYWTCLCFDSREQKEAFLKALAWDQVSNGDDILDGVALAKQLGIALPPTPASLVFYREKSSKTLNTLALPL
jgi:hypothetical protein